MNEIDKKIDELTKNILDEKLAHMDAATLLRLNRIRHQALSNSGRPRRSWVPAGLLTAATALALAMAVLMRPPSPVPETPAPLEDLEMLVSSESLDMLADLEFYLWLEGELERG